MWTETYHRFVDEAAFLAACDAAGWARGSDGKANGKSESQGLFAPRGEISTSVRG